MMSFLDLQTLKVEHADSSCFNSGAKQCHQLLNASQFEMYDIPDLGTVSVPGGVGYPAPSPYASPGGDFISVQTPLGFGSSENYHHQRVVPHSQSHKVPSGSAPANFHADSSTTSTSVGKRLNGSCRHRATYSGRRATSERRDRINERERDRMHMLCDAFEKLRQVLPLKKPMRGPHRQKLSKISTLVFAQNYIRTLEDILRNPGEYADCQLSSSEAAAQRETGGLAPRGSEAISPSQSAPSPGQSNGALYSTSLNSSELYHEYSDDIFDDGPSYASYCGI